VVYLVDCCGLSLVSPQHFDHCDDEYRCQYNGDIRELKNHDDDFVDDDRKWDTMYCAIAASKFRRRGLVDDAKHSSVTSSCFTSFGRYKSSVFRRFFKCSMLFFVFVNPGILSFFAQQAMLTENSANEFFFLGRMTTTVNVDPERAISSSYKFVLFCTYISRKGKSR